MNHVQVWSTYAGLRGIQVRLTAGEAIDASLHDDVLEGVLYYEGDLDEILQEKREVFCYNKEHLARYFYFSKEAALQAARISNPEWVEEHSNIVRKCYICPAKYKRVDLPVEAILSQNEKGLYCRMNLRPDVFGTRTAGKMYFPDRSCKNQLRPGPVVITEVFERTSYGFIVCHMK